MRQFEKVQAKRPKRSAFDLSHERKTTINMGEIVPVLCHEILPGDRFKISFETFLRTMPLISPVMHRVNLYAHCFFVPNRLLLAPGVWEKFITQTTGAISALPSLNSNVHSGAPYTVASGDLADHLGYGYKYGSVQGSGAMSQLPIRGYHKIWDDYYKDQNFQTSYDVTALPDDLAAGNANLPLFMALRKRCWEKDYFTSALPTPQRGTAVTVPLGSTAPVRGVASQNLLFRTVATGAVPISGQPIIQAGGVLNDTTGSSPINVYQGLEADLSNATGSSISALRRAYALQRWYEASMRFGQRYIEQLLGLFGVVSKDARLQRSEYLGGGKLPVQIGEVLQTSATVAGQTPQGNMAGKGISAGSQFYIDKTFDEHGYIYILVSVLPRTSYATMALRQNFKLTTFDFAFPQLAHLSEQPVYAGELWNENVTDAGARATWGYQPIYSEYRYIPDSVHGDFRSSLGYWSLARDFAAAPALNSTFVISQPRTDIFPVAFANQQMILQTYAKIIAIRPLPKFGTPL